MAGTIRGLWGSLAGCARPRGYPVYRRNRRVANPPQDAILPHKDASCRGRGETAVIGFSDEVKVHREFDGNPDFVIRALRMWDAMRQGH